MGNFHSLQVVCHGSKTQLRVGKNLNYLIHRLRQTSAAVHIQILVFRRCVEPDQNKELQNNGFYGKPNSSRVTT